jgi:hypothetical protein
MAMDNDRAAQETIARCLSIMVAYHNSGTERGARQAMVKEIRVVAAAIKVFSLSVWETVERIVHPVESELFARYGHELGARLNAEFVEAFEGYGVPEGRALETAASASDVGVTY